MATNRQRLRKQARRKHFNKTSRPTVLRPLFHEGMSMLLLRTEATERKIPGRSKMTKAELIEALNCSNCEGGVLLKACHTI